MTRLVGVGPLAIKLVDRNINDRENKEHNAKNFHGLKI
jgi:hypothetical protein